MASNCTRVSAERAGLRAQLIYLFEPLCVWSHWHPLEKGSALFPLVSPTKGEAFIFYFLSKVPQTCGLRTCVDTPHMHVLWFGQRQNQTRRNEEARLNHFVILGVVVLQT